MIFSLLPESISMYVPGKPVSIISPAIFNFGDEILGNGDDSGDGDGGDSRMIWCGEVGDGGVEGTLSSSTSDDGARYSGYIGAGIGESGACSGDCKAALGAFWSDS
nr:hypothetical protein [Tanacetum cinerariifolium]